MTEFLLVITAILFYFIGRWSKSDELDQKVDDLIGRIPQANILKRPSKKELESKHKNKYTETEEAMEEAFDEIMQEPLSDNG